MTGLEHCAEMDAPPSSSCKEGPVLTMINKRLRAFKKKLNKINQIEESKAHGKQINKEQEEVLKSKTAVLILVDEYEKLRGPLMVAVREEIEKEITEMGIKNEERSTGNGEEHEHEHTVEEEMLGLRIEDAERCTTQDEKPIDEHDREVLCNKSLPSEDSINVEPEVTDVSRMDTSGFVAAPFELEVIELLHLLYFAQLFDVPRADASPSLVWTRVHERSSCVSYDLVTEEDTSSPLAENDLNDLALLGSLITSRPPNATLSHRDALQQCAQHALLWICNSDTPIMEGLTVTYSHVKERLHRILSSEYYTMMPELQTFGQQAVAAAASAAGQYSSQMLIHAALSGSGPSLYYTNQERVPEPLVPNEEQYTSAMPVRSIISEMPDSHMVMNTAAVSAPEPNIMKDVDKVDVKPGSAGSTINQEQQQQQQQDLQLPLATVPLQNTRDSEVQEQQQESEIPAVSADSRGSQGLNSGATFGSNNGRSRSRGSGRGGQGTSRGGYGIGRGTQIHDQRGYYPRNQYGRGIGRSMRATGSSTSNGYSNGQATSSRASGGAPT